MNRSLALTGVALGAVLAAGGCAGPKKAATIAASASAKAKASAQARATPRASKTLAGRVNVGKFCSPAGVVAKTTSGAWARCVKRQGEPRARWVPATKGGGGVAKAGQFCATE